MTLPTFTIDTDPAHEFLHLTLTGDWDVAITERFAIAVAQALRDMAARGARPGHFRTLIDMREKNILPQNVAAEFAKMVRPDSPSRRIAMLASSALHAFQARRLSDDRRRVFSDEGEAIVWLFEGLPLPPALRALHGAC